MLTLPRIILPGLVVLVANWQLWHQTIEANWQQSGSDWIGAIGSNPFCIGSNAL
jgi:hypothetical protein